MPTKVTVTLGEIPANQSAIILLPARVEGAKRASDVAGEFSNTVTYNVPGEQVDPDYERCCATVRSPTPALTRRSR